MGRQVDRRFERDEPTTPLTNATKPDKPYSPDIALFLVLIPFIAAFNYYLTYTNIQLNWFLALTFAIDTVQGYAAWAGVRALILFYDRKLPYEHGATKRIVVQLFTTLLLGLIIISLLTELVSWIAKSRPAPLSFYTIDLVIISIWFFVINGIYIGLHYYNQWQASEAQRHQENRTRTDGIMVRQGKHDIKLHFENVDGFYIDGDYAVACQGTRKYYLDQSQSLDKIEKSLPPGVFFRLNRQYILSRPMISGYKRLENGKLLIVPVPSEHFPAEIPMSRTKAPAFKAWFRPDDRTSP
jgi:DNA-binding LytR/AlgR family response regulator